MFPVEDLIFWIEEKHSSSQPGVLRHEQHQYHLKDPCTPLCDTEDPGKGQELAFLPASQGKEVLSGGTSP